MCVYYNSVTILCVGVPVCMYVCVCVHTYVCVFGRKMVNSTSVLFIDHAILLTCIPYRGASHSGNSGDVVVKLEELRQHKEELEREEKELDEQCQRMKQCLKNITEDTYSDEYP